VERKLRRIWTATWCENGKVIFKLFEGGLRPEHNAWLLAMHTRRAAEERLPGLLRNKWPELPLVRYKRYRQPKRPDRTAEFIVKELRAYIVRCLDTEKDIAKYIDAIETKNNKAPRSVARLALDSVSADEISSLGEVRKRRVFPAG